MPEQLLGRIIRLCSNPGELVLDPFSGSGTTLAVAKKLERRFIGFELSSNYAEKIQARLDAIKPGDKLAGADEPTVKAPPTHKGKRRPEVAAAMATPITIRRTRKEKRAQIESSFAVQGKKQKVPNLQLKSASGGFGG
jgi:site-specific DNA-methyltransferase (adenine-specific)